MRPNQTILLGLAWTWSANPERRFSIRQIAVLPLAGCRWRGDEELASYASAVAATIHGRRPMFCLTRQGLVSLNPTHGEVFFSHWFQSPVNESVNAMCPVVADAAARSAMT